MTAIDECAKFGFIILFSFVLAGLVCFIWDKKPTSELDESLIEKKLKRKK